MLPDGGVFNSVCKVNMKDQGKDIIIPLICMKPSGGCMKSENR